MAASIPHHYWFDEESCSSNILNNMSINGAINMQLPSMLNYDDDMMINSPVSLSHEPEPPLPLPLVMNSADCMQVVPQMSSEIETGFRDFSSCDYNQINQVFEAGEDHYCTTAGYFWPQQPYSPNIPMPSPQNWAIQGKAAVAKVEETDQVKVGRYSVEERKDRILRYLKKRNHRNFNKTIKYACRKTLADKRVRVRGRFAKNNEPSQEEEDHIFINTTDHHHHHHHHHHISNYHEHNNSFHEEDDDDSFQMKYDDDYWLQAAMDNINIGHLPYLAS
ncbi:hypothetical protein C2S51_008441 [Perilla frutescens var. frutescens]|nr:hypothetical protein C2S51_008441 [Perilla frutescens var. frutescens]